MSGLSPSQPPPQSSILSPGVRASSRIIHEPSTHASYPGIDEPVRQHSPAGADKRQVAAYPGVVLHNILNLRDISVSGGYSNACGRKVRIKKGRLFRASSPWHGDDDDAAAVVLGLKVRTIVDLRTQDENNAADVDSPLMARVQSGEVTHVVVSILKPLSEFADLVTYMSCASCCGMLCYGLFGCCAAAPPAAAPAPAPAGAVSSCSDCYRTSSCCSSTQGPGLRERFKSAIMPAVNARGLMGMYSHMLDRSGDRLCAVLALYLDETNYPILWHCTAGKDRTGIVAMLLLSVLGCGDAAICEDYNLSDVWSLELHARNAAIGGMGGVDARMARAPAKTMAATLAYVRGRYGSVDGYLDRIGFDAGMRDKLRKLNLEPDEEEPWAQQLQQQQQQPQQQSLPSPTPPACSADADADDDGAAAIAPLVGGSLRNSL